MKYLLLSIFVALFAVAPGYLLNTVVMPQLNQMKQSYQTYDQTAANIANAR